MKTLLLVSYFFPPIQDTESTMAFHSIKYLPRFGYKSIVLSAKKSKKENIDSFSSNSIISIYRTSSLENILTRVLSYLRILPDSKIMWFFSAVRKGMRILKGKDINVLISRSTPVTSHFIALQLKQATKIPWVACFSDPWTQNPYISYPPGFKKLHEFFERAVINNADRIVVTTEQAKRLLLKNYQIPEKIRVIPNSFDSSEIPKGSEKCRKEELVITHVGNFYGIRSPEPFLKALAAIHEEGNIKNEIKVRFIGSLGPFGKLISKYRLDGMVQLIGTVPRRDALVSMVDSDILLLIDAPSEKESIFLPSKLVEYISIGKPILAITPKGASADVVRSTRTGIVVFPEDEKGIQRAIKGYYNLWKHSKLKINPNIDEIKQYTAEVHAERLHRVIQEIT